MPTSMAQSEVNELLFLKRLGEQASFILNDASERMQST